MERHVNAAISPQKVSLSEIESKIEEPVTSSEEIDEEDDFDRRWNEKFGEPSDKLFEKDDFFK